ncbi:MAG: glutamate-1-semialdehyde 2,1-aminomutase [Gemmatimonadetes bacterium]|nr:glutamate-1-semialdehyde 2,1-aminomutase [Gemmatimonadota bacterium]MDE3260023.1 glutamate-1-semialdehyde 2,1-aminomutase [Gemmatimonadota bacterium]
MIRQPTHKRECYLGNRSAALFETAQRVIPGGVNSPARAFGPVGGQPLFITRGRGSKVYDADGREYIDYVCSWGPLILGHAPEVVVEALQGVCELGTSFGAPTEIEVEMARLVTDLVPGVEMVRMVNSGTEATMSAVRLARGYTGREKVIKFEGCWHGHADSFLIQAGSSALTTGVPSSPGVTAGTASGTVTATYNDLDAVRRIVAESPDEIAAVIVEPVAGNMGVIPPAEGFLQGLRELAHDNGIVLIFDEVITGFRVHPGGAQGLYGITPDLTTLGKIIGGGLPVGAFGGRREIMSHISPLGKGVSQAGTLSGNPLAMTAGFETLMQLREPGAYESLEGKSAALEAGFRENLKSLGLPFCLNRVGSMMTLFFTDRAVTRYEAAVACDQDAFARYFRLMLEQGVYLAPSQFEAAFVSLAHSDEDIDRTVKAQYTALKQCVS